jgi:hypothetical protein
VDIRQSSFLSKKAFISSLKTHTQTGAMETS